MLTELDFGLDHARIQAQDLSVKCSSLDVLDLCTINGGRV